MTGEERRDDSYKAEETNYVAIKSEVLPRIESAQERKEEG